MDGKRDLWSDLSRVVRTDVAWHQRQSVVNLCDWNESEKQCLSMLSDEAKGGLSSESKRYKYRCCVFETCFAVVVSPRMNVPMNPTCEWWLRWYGKN
jgi:hypothetical protein